MEISGIRVADGNFNVTSDVDSMYTGNIAGFAIALIRGNVDIHDCFSTNAITVNNSTGYSYAGGIVGKLYTGAGSLARITRCYNTGKISATSHHSSRAGGLVGNIFSYGSGYIYDGSEKEDDPYLSATEEETYDEDKMIVDCFAVAEIYSNSTHFTSYAGLITAECNTHAVVINTYYPSNINIPVTAVNNPNINNVGIGVPNSTFTIEELLTETCGFDFENTWTFISNNNYPVLKCMVSDKPVFKLVGSSYENNTLGAMIQVVAPSENFVVIIGVYNERDQLVAIKRETFTNISGLVEFNVSFENVKKASYMTISAVEKSSLMPLFEGIKTRL